MYFLAKFLLILPVILWVQLAQASCLGTILNFVKDSIELRGKIFGYHRTLASSKHIQVYGSTYHSFKMEKFGRGILQRTERFDQALTNMGFTKPKHTTIYINKGQIIERTHGPHHMVEQSFNIWNGKINDVIVLNEWGMAPNRLLKSKSILQHERMHSILNSTYASNAFVIKRNVVQEALADFTTAFLNNDPKHAFNFYENNYALRNIKERKFSSSRNNYVSIAEMNSIAKFDGSYHHNSILFSNVLWEIYEKVGKRKMEKILKPIIDDLNSHYDSFLALNKTFPDIYIGESDRASFLYFLSSIDNTMKKFPDIEKDVRNILQTKSLESHLSHYDEIKKLLSSSNNDYTQQKSRVKEAAKLIVKALPTEIGLVYITYKSYDVIKNLFFNESK